MFEKVRGKRVVDNIAQQLRGAIFSESFAPGETLPSERDLADKFGTSRLSLRNAIAQLVSEGLLSVRQGHATQVKDLSESGTLDLLGELIRSQLGSPRSARIFKDLLELRRWASAEVIALACERRTAAHLRSLEQAVAVLAETADRADHTRLELSACEREIAIVLVDAADNFGFKMLFHTLQRVLTAMPWLRDGLPHHPETLKITYQQMLDWVRAKQPEPARTAARVAFEWVDGQLMKNFGRAKTARARA